MEEKNEYRDLFDFFNLILKGILCGLGAGGEYKKRAVSVKANLHPERGYEHLMEEFTDSLKKAKLSDGDVVVFPAKLFAIAQNRLLPSSFLEKYGKPSRLPNNLADKLIAEAKKEFGLDIERIDVYASDKTYVKDGFSSLLPSNPNRIASDIAEKIKKHLNKLVDVVVTDTLNIHAHKQSRMSGFPSLLATPIGATKGIVPHDLIRASVAAEVVRNKERNTPIVILKAEKGFVRKGPNIGKFRYNGRIDIGKEKNVLDFLRNVWERIR